MSQLFGETFTLYTIYASTGALGAVDMTLEFDGVMAQVTGGGIYKYSKQATSGTVQATGGGFWSLAPFPYLMLTAANVIDSAQIVNVGNISLADGTAALPAMAFALDPDIGLYRIGANSLGFSTNGVLRVTLNTAALTSTLPLALPAGTAAAPTFAIGAEQTGLYLISAGNLGFSVAGVLKATLSATVLTLVTGIQLKLPASTAAAPAFTLGAEQTGLYLVGAGSLGFSVAGAIKANLTATALNMATGVALQVATVQVVGPRETGWTTSAGAATKNQGAVNSSTITATDGNVQALAQWLKGLTDALILHGLIGA